MFGNVKRGFALLLAIVIISIVLAIGLSILNITLKQLTLSSTVRDSETAIHVAQSALECIRFYRKAPVTGDEFLDGGTILPSISCSSIATLVAAGSSASTPISITGGTVYKYVYQFDWELGTAGIADDACSETSLYHIDASINTGPASYNFINEGIDNITCTSGRMCTVIFSRGFNRQCSDIVSIRTVQREMTFSTSHVLTP